MYLEKRGIYYYFEAAQNTEVKKVGFIPYKPMLL